MEPEVAATGHGIPMHGVALRSQLAVFANQFDAVARPKSGRYTQPPATADGDGVTSVPPLLMRPWLKVAAVAGLVLGAVALATAGRKTSNGNSNSQQKGFQNQTQHRPRHDHTTAVSEERYSDSESRKIETQYP